MLEFKYKKHVRREDKKFVVYYNAYDIALGLLFMGLVMFFMSDYLSHALPVEKMPPPIIANQ